jgi:hypothetical protein
MRPAALSSRSLCLLLMMIVLCGCRSSPSARTPPSGERSPFTRRVHSLEGLIHVLEPSDSAWDTLKVGVYGKPRRLVEDLVAIVGSSETWRAASIEPIDDPPQVVVNGPPDLQARVHRYLQTLRRARYIEHYEFIID